MMNKIFLLLIFILSLNSVLNAQWRNYPWQEIQNKDFERYIEWIDGSFSSRDQSIEEPYFSHVVVYQRVIRYDLINGVWVYIQQGMFQDQPYRQRMYHIYQLNDSTIISKSYRIKDLLSMDSPYFMETLNNLTLDDIDYMNECDSYIYMGADGYFYGSLANKKCPGTYAGATHTTSDFRVYPDMIVSWERGWRGDIQLWGSSRGYYYFRRY